MKWSSTRTSISAERVAQARVIVAIGLARLGHAGRMVVREDHRGGVVRQATPHDFARMHAGAVDRAAEQFLEGDHAMAVVEEQAGEHLVRIARARRDLQVVGAAPGSVSASAVSQFGVEIAPAEFERGVRAGSLGRTGAELRAVRAASRAAASGRRRRRAVRGRGRRRLAAPAASR